LSGARPVTVMGLGLFGGGAAVARYLARSGARVTVTDLRTASELAPALAQLSDCDVRYVLGEHRKEDFRAAELVVANPAVPPSSPYLAAARDAGVPITSEAALFLDRCPARVAAITGTQGKSSCASFLAQILSGSGVRAWLGGNIGRSLLDVLDEMAPEHVAVIELSSYQLEVLPDQVARRGADSPVELAAVTNVLADHLERHGSRAAYARAKARVLELVRPGGTALLPADFEGEPPPGVARLGPAPRSEGEADRAAIEALGLPGFQHDNLRLALRAARCLGADEPATRAALAGTEAPPHRLEHLGTLRGRAIWDNGVSTTPDSTVSAMRALEPGFVLLCGGKDKRLPLEELVAVARARASRVVVFGAAAPAWVPLLRAAGVQTHAARGVEEGLALCLEQGREGEALLFSPAAASFDAWPNFRARALAFRAALGPLDD